MKLNPHILSTTIALITSVAFATELEKPSQTTITTANGGSKASASVVGGKGKATVTIDVNGKKETREIDLGHGTEIKVITGNEEGGGPSTVASVAKVNTPRWASNGTGDCCASSASTAR